MSRDATGCAEFHRAGHSRRRMMRIGALSGLALGLAEFLRIQETAGAAAARPASFGRARSVIMIYLHGGPAQMETWDPKPEGPHPERGEFGAIATSVPGVHFSELLPRSARWMHKASVIRSLTHPNANHVQASLPAMTGRHHPPGTESRGDFPPSPTDFPAIGAAIDLTRPSRSLPSWVQIGPTMTRSNGTVLHGQSPGFLGPARGPLVIDQDLTPERVAVDAVAPDPAASSIRLTSRRSLLEQFDTQRRAIDATQSIRVFDGYQRRALDLLGTPEMTRAFDISAEPASARDAYGRNGFGQSCLLARRLAAAGVPMISVHYCRRPPGWDTHGRHFAAMRDSLCPTLDTAFDALLTDLDRSGLLDSTLVWVNGEFGRTPRVNSGAGRDHWPWAYSQILAGGGIAEGACLGATDAIAAHPTRDPHDPSDLVATIFHLLGVPPDTTIHDQVGRPHALVNGDVITSLLR